MEIIKAVVGYMLIYWFSLTTVPTLLSKNTQLPQLLAACLGFALILQILPNILTFFKLPAKNIAANILLGSILTTIYTYIIKNGVIGLVYIPYPIIIGDVSDPKSIFRFELSEFGVILYIGISAIILYSIINLLKTGKK